MLETLSSIYEHVIQNNRQGKSMVTISWSSRRPSPCLLEDMYTSLGFLNNKGVVVICAAGNHAQQRDGSRLRSLVNTYPAMVPYTIAVGNSDNYGRKWPRSQVTAARQLYAPGVEIQCAEVKSNESYQTGTRTSYYKFTQYTLQYYSHAIKQSSFTLLTAPLVANVIARLFPLKTPMLAPLTQQTLLKRCSWRRPDKSGILGAEYVISNAMTSRDNPPAMKPVGLSPSNSSLLSSNDTATA